MTDKDLLNFFLTCNKVKIFWWDFIQWWNNLCNSEIGLLSQNLVETKSDQSAALNFVILQAKNTFIYKEFTIITTLASMSLFL